MNRGFCRRLTLSLLLVVALAVGLVPAATAAPPAVQEPPTAPESRFTDWPSGSWCEAALSWGVENGVVYGRTGTTVDPWATAKRSEFAALLNRALAAYNPRSLSGFSDADPESWYYDELAKSYQMGALQGTGDTTMSPDQTVTREQAITVLSRILCLPAPDDAEAILADYADADELAPWARVHAAATVQAGIIVGTAEDQLSPGKEITRAELVQALRRVFYRFADGTAEITGNHAETVIVRSPSVTVHDATFSKDLIIAHGVRDAALDLKNVTIKGRLLVWGGSTINVIGNSHVAAVTVPRNDAPVKVLFDPAATAASQGCVVAYPDISAPDNEVIFSQGGSGGTSSTAPSPPPPPAGPEDVPLPYAVAIMYWDWDNTLLDVQYVNHSDVRQDVNDFVSQNFIHPALVGNPNVSSLARIDNYRGDFPAEGPRPLGTTTETVAPDGADYPLTNKLDYVFFKRVTSVAGGVWSQATGSGAYDTAYPYIHGWLHTPAPGVQSPSQGDFTDLENYYSVLGHTGELAKFNGHAATSGKMDSLKLTTENAYLRVADFSDIRKMENAGHIVSVKAIYEPGEDLLGPDEGFYTMTVAPQYMKSGTWASGANPNTAVYEISFALSRFWAAADGVHGVSRVRTPSIDCINVIDMFSIGVHDHSRTFHHEIPLQNGETINVLWEGVATVHAINPRLVDVYQTNFVVGPVRSLDNDKQPTPVLPNYACEAYEALGYGNDTKVGPDDEFLPVPDSVFGTDGFVYRGAMNLVKTDLTAYVLTGKSESTHWAYAADLNIRNGNRSFLDGYSLSGYLMEMARTAYQAHLSGNDEWWNSETETLDLTYHQIQHYVLTHELLTRAEADAITIPWCKLHEACMASDSNALAGKE